MPDDPLISEVLDRLDGDTRATGRVENLVLGALLGQLDEVIDGEVVQRPEAVAETEQPQLRAYLESVTTTGFRGIGPTCELPLQPGPGLTLVVGRNGSGKSSIAEAAEFALTGDSLRWSGKTLDWKNGWRNLHAKDVPQIVVNLRVEGEREPRTVRVRWRNSKLDSTETVVTVPGTGRHSLDSLGWSSAVTTFRPFLSYQELSTIVEGRPVDRFRALAPMLGMESLQEPVESLRQARLAADKRLKEANESVSSALVLLRDSLDDRASTARQALSDDWDLDEIEALVRGTDPATAEREGLLLALEQVPAPDPEGAQAAASNLRQAVESVEALRGTDADRAQKLAGLLQSAVKLHEEHGDADCPVCGREQGLHRSRIVELREEIQRLNSEAEAVIKARRVLSAARRNAEEAIGTAPQILEGAAREDIGVDVEELKTAWATWTDRPDDDTRLATHLEMRCAPIAAATEAVRLAAKNLRRQLADQWRPVADELGEMLPIARTGQRAAATLPALKRAEKWLKRCEASIRDERFEEVRTQVKHVWDTLAVGSNVTLEDVRLGNKKVDMDVTVDGDASAALGVMSQGELHALALSLFIPRVKFDQSPFGFAVLDDPVQAMDPVRVAGLAKVLDNLAKTRQVLVFTHDDRLPAAIRQLQLPATVWSVTRRPKSGVELKKSLDPMKAAIDDARAVELSGGLPEEARRQVVPGLCRQAIEAACLESGRRRLLATGMSHRDCDEMWARETRLLPRIAIALYGDAQRAGDVIGGINNRYGRRAGDTVLSCNRLSHTAADDSIDLKDLIRRAESLAEELAAL